MRLTVLIVHDHAPFRTSASALLESEGFDVIGEAADGKAAISESERLRPVELDARARIPGPSISCVANTALPS
jgi:DNA-binding NarL/FixJ family response regulator